MTCAVIKAAKMERPVLVGWSYSGHVVVDYLRQYGVDDGAGINLVGSVAGMVQLRFLNPLRWVGNSPQTY